MTQRQLETLNTAECMALLGQEHIGRLVYLDERGPVAEPVNYLVAGTDIVFRVEGGTKVRAMAQPLLAFEVDQVDEETRSGWSVIVRGTGSEVALPQVPDLIRRAEGQLPGPWAIGVHNVWLQITPTSVTGRRLGAVRLPVIF